MAPFSLGSPSSLWLKVRLPAAVPTSRPSCGFPLPSPWPPSTLKDSGDCLPRRPIRIGAFGACLAQTSNLPSLSLFDNPVRQRSSPALPPVDSGPPAGPMPTKLPSFLALAKASLRKRWKINYLPFEALCKFCVFNTCTKHGGRVLPKFSRVAGLCFCHGLLTASGGRTPTKLPSFPSLAREPLRKCWKINYLPFEALCKFRVFNTCTNRG